MFSLSSIILFILFLTILIIGHELGHFFAAKLFRRKIEELGFGFPPRLFSRKIGETVYSLNLIPFGGFVKIHGEVSPERLPATSKEDVTSSFRTLSPAKKAVVIVAGAAMNFLIGWVALSIVFMIGVAPVVFINQVVPKSPAEVAGFVSGDIILGFSTAEEFTQFISANKGKEIIVELLRDEREMTLAATPRIDPPEGEGSLGIVVTQGEIPKRSFIPALTEGLTSSLEVVRRTILGAGNIIGSLFTGEKMALQQVTGPLGLIPIVGTASKLGAVYILQLLALISLNLTVINLIPFPALDGGRLLFTLFEAVIRRPLGYRFEVATNTVGFVFLLFLMVAITIKDIANLLS